MSLGCYEEEVNEGYDENNYEASHSRNDNVLFLIDARCSMLEPVPPTMPTTPPAHGGGCIKHEVSHPFSKHRFDHLNQTFSKQWLAQISSFLKKGSSDIWKSNSAWGGTY